ncbi:MAG: hypothetical protein ABEK36_01550 [Candidatus Aenigmatarchaeota archaeon]
MKNSKILMILVEIVFISVLMSLISLSVNAETWQSQFIGDGTFSSIRLDSFGNPRICYYDSKSKDLVYIKWTKTGWEYETVDSDGDVGKYNSLVLDSNNNPYISYYSSTNGNLKYAKEINDKWRVETIDSGDNTGLYSSIDLDSSGKPHISYYDFSNKRLMHAYKGVELWKKEAVEEEYDVGKFSSIQVDDHIHISYFDAENQNLLYSEYDGDVWKTSIVDEEESGMYTSLELDNSGNPHISYSGAESGLVKYAFEEKGIWNNNVIDDESSIGGDTSLEFSEGKFHLVYSDSKNNLVYAVSDNDNSWETRIPDNSSFVSNDVSIVVGSYGRAYITYPDINVGKIKYLTYYTVPSKPINLRAIAGDGDVKLQWVEPSNNGGKDIEEHYVYRMDSSGKRERIASLRSPKTSYVDDSVYNGQNYRYYVTALNVIGESKPSNNVDVTPTSQSNFVGEDPEEIEDRSTASTVPEEGVNKTTDHIKISNTGEEEEKLPLYLILPLIIIIVIILFKRRES